MTQARLCFVRKVCRFAMKEQLPLSPRRKKLPVKRRDWSRLMICELATCALIELMQIGKTPSSTDPVLHHAPEACNRIEMVSTMRRQEMQPKLLVPVCQRRRELMRPVDATAVGHHDHLFASVAKEGHHLMDILAKPLRLKMGGIRLRRDSWVSVVYAEGLNSTTSSVTLQRTDRHGILGQKSADFQLS